MGSFSGVTAGNHIRQILAEMGDHCNFFTIPKVFDDEGKLLDKNYERRFSRFLEEFEWYVSALERLERLIDYAQSLVLGITL